MQSTHETNSSFVVDEMADPAIAADHVIDTADAVSEPEAGVAASDADNQSMAQVAGDGNFSTDLSTVAERNALTILADRKVSSSLPVSDPTGHGMSTTGNAGSHANSELTPTLSVNAANPADVTLHGFWSCKWL